MHVTVLVGLLLALTCAAGASLAGLWKQKGAVHCRSVDIRRPKESAVALFRSKWFLIGWLAAVVAWLLHIGALALAPLSLGQAVISGGIVLVGILAERFFDFKLKRRQWIGLAVLGIGMGILAATAHSDSNHTRYGIVALVCFELVAVGVGVLCALSLRSERLKDHRGVLLGISAGIWFGVSDISIKAVTSGDHGLWSILGPWVWLGILCAVGAFFASARSFQIGEGIGVIAASTAAANLLGIVAGILVFGDPLGKNTLTVAGRLLAFTLVVVALTLVPAPVRAEEAAREKEEEKVESQAADGAPASNSRGKREEAAPALRAG
jgi:drug/metabolite transporter (DMT)-like permease